MYKGTCEGLSDGRVPFKSQVHKGVQDVVILLLETFVPVGVGLGHDRIQHPLGKDQLVVLVSLTGVQGSSTVNNNTCCTITV